MEKEKDIFETYVGTRQLSWLLLVCYNSINFSSM